MQTHTYYKPYNITWLRLYILLLRFIYSYDYEKFNLSTLSDRLRILAILVFKQCEYICLP